MPYLLGRFVVEYIFNYLWVMNLSLRTPVTTGGRYIIANIIGPKIFIHFLLVSSTNYHGTLLYNGLIFANKL